MKLFLALSCVAVLDHVVYGGTLRTNSVEYEIGPDGSMVMIPDDVSGQLIRRRVEATKFLQADPDYLLHLCQGDCDNDDDCSGSLVCWQREAGEPVPGCIGGENDMSQSDYCVHADVAASALDASSTTATAAPTPALTSAPTPDSTAAPTPTTTIAPTPAITSAPTPDSTVVADATAATATASFTSTTSFDSAKALASFKTYQQSYTNSHGNHQSSNGPLQECQGHCTDDNDCADGLECYYRDAFEAVPGCPNRINDGSMSDYCVKVDQTHRSNPALSISPVPFRMKLFWQLGYYWQEETIERKWCMQCKKPGQRKEGPCLKGHEMYINECDQKKNEYFVFVHTRREQALIKLVKKNLCLQRDFNSVYLEDCDIFNTNQLWYARDGSFDNSHFEVSQRTYSGRCLTQRHHPKPWEWMEIEPCYASRILSNTTFWEPLYDY